MTPKEIAKITGMNEKTAQSYDKLFAAILLHDVAEEALGSETGRLKSSKMYIPRVGTIKVKFVHTKKRQYTFIPDKDFDRKVLKAWRNGESPLISLVESSIVAQINRTYNNLI